MSSKLITSYYKEVKECVFHIVEIFMKTVTEKTGNLINSIKIHNYHTIKRSKNVCIP